MNLSNNRGQEKPQNERVELNFSIIVPTFNRADLLSRALQSIQNLKRPNGCAIEVIVVANNCTDHTRQVCQSSTGPYTVRHVEESRQGLNHARNRGALSASFGFLVYLDDDMLVDPDWLVACEEIISADRTVDAVVGPVRPDFVGKASRFAGPRAIASLSSKYSDKGDRVSVLGVHEAHEMPGCNFGVRRELVLALGGFHPLLDRNGRGMMGGGDSEFGYRLGVNNRKIVYIPGCAIEHQISEAKASLRGLVRRWKGVGRSARAIDEMHRSGLIPMIRRQRLMAILQNSARVLVCAARGRMTEATDLVLVCARDVSYLAFSAAEFRAVDSCEVSLRKYYSLMHSETIP